MTRISFLEALTLVPAAAYSTVLWEQAGPSRIAHQRVWATSGL